ncbi:MAG: aldose epimerase family protein [Bacteroidales bacterium]
MNCIISPFGKIDNEKVSLYTFITEDGLEISITNYGAIITAINLHRGENNCLKLAYGFEHLQPYVDCNFYPGAIVGRYANRIAGAEFNIDNQHFNLTKNEGNNQLHGGFSGFNSKVWETQLFEQVNGVCTVKFYLRSSDLEEGFPGNIDVWVTYQITDDNQISINYSAITDKSTHVNLTSHSYFNLSGFESDVLDHMLTIKADQYLPVNEQLIPTGEKRDLTGTPFDFRQPKAIGADIDLVDGLYDHCFVLSNPSLNDPSVILKNPKIDIKLSVYTTQPGIQLYTPLKKPTVANGIDIPSNGNWAICIEPQHFPNTPNTSEFPSTLLKPNQEYNQTTILSFDLGE